MSKAEKFLLGLALLLAVLTPLFFALPTPQAAFSQRPLAPAATSAPEERLDINQATAEQLDALPGIGEVLAERILQYREEHGGFSSTAELMEVKGIGASRFAAIEDYIRCQEEMP